MAKKILPKPALPAPQETGRQAAFDELFNRRLREIGAHLGELSTILYEHHDRIESSPTVQGVMSLLEAYSSELIELGKPKVEQEGGAR